MSNRKYPSLRRFTPLEARKNKKCEICGERACCYATVEFDWFRGDDGVYYLCQSHKDQMRADLNKMLDLLPVED